MTVETEVANLTTAVDNLAEAVNVKKATLDASVADAESARDAAAASATTASGHATSAAASAAAAASTASGIAGFDLDAIAASKAVTAVDVFVYDTSKDSDGGAWRKRTQHTSWYNETLNTATRGGRREFPAVAVIVAEAANVTIYDGDDPSLPMWMVFTPGGSGSNFNFLITGSTRTSCTALNGKLTIGNGVNAVVEVSFIDERVQQRYSSGMFYWSAGIVDRNSTPSRLGGSDTVNRIVNSTVNDVAMTVLPNAPIDAATGLPVPTIAVATNGGVSVITDSGAVYDSASTGGGHTKIGFTKDRKLVYQNSVTNGNRKTFVLDNIPTADGFTADRTYGDGGTTSADLQILSNSYSASPVHADGGFVSAGYSQYPNANNRGFVVVHENTADASSGMVVKIDGDYNTGWMNGDIKGAFLSDTDDTDLVGSGELVTNGTFDTDTSGWTVDDGSRGITATVSGGQVTIDSTAASSAGSAIKQTVSGLTGGTKYVITFTVVSINTGALALYNSGTSTQANYGVGTHSVTFTGGTSVLLDFKVTGIGQIIVLDNVSVKLADADRSVNNNGLIINGTVTRSAVATGAELVAYSGFSASNYLEQPYNSDLDFGTGDFCIMGWFKRTATSGNILDRGNGSDSNNRIQFHIYSASEFRVVLSGAALATSAIPSGVWTHLTYARRNGVGYLYVNSNLGISGTQSGNVSGTNATKIGVSQFLGDPCPGDLALFRISATAPTAEQIKKIYEDEKVLFQENAKAVLAGTSDAVTALAYDDATSELLVGTSQYTSVFRGLRRVDEISGSASAISASNGLRVIED